MEKHSNQFQNFDRFYFLFVRFLFIFFITLEIVQSAVVNCKFESKEWGLHNGFQYACVVQNNLLLARGEKITAVTGQHQAGKSHADVKGFATEGKIVNFVPKDIEKFFPNIIALTFANANINEIHEDDFKPFPKLRAVFMMNNQVRELERNLFRNNPSMGEIKLNNNKIEHVENAFDNLPQLTFLFLNENICINAEAWSTEKVVNLVKQVREKCSSNNVETCEVRNQRLESAIENLKSEVKKTEAEKLSLTESVKNLSGKIETLKEETKVLSDNNKSLRLKVESLQKENVKLTTEVEFYLETVADLQRNVKSLENAKKFAEAKIVEISCLVNKWSAIASCVV